MGEWPSKPVRQQGLHDCHDRQVVDKEIVGMNRALARYHGG